MMLKRYQTLWLLLACALLNAHGQDAFINIQANKPGHRLSRYLTGACIEDVNHEIYGGLYSQMIFGESFQEPALSVPPKGFTGFDGRWTVQDGELLGSAGEGPKLLSEFPPFEDGEASVELFFADRKPGNAGLIMRAAGAGKGADNFEGYEISLDPAAQILRLGRHRHNWEHISDTPCQVPVGQWIGLTAKVTGKVIEVLVNGQSVTRYEDGPLAPLSGTVGLRQWQREVKYQNLVVKTGNIRRALPFRPAVEREAEISGMWRMVQRGDCAGSRALESLHPFLGSQSQRISFQGGTGEYGIENQGLNRWGMYFVEGKKYEGLLWARTEAPVEVFVALESADGGQIYDEERLKLEPGEWQKLEFTLTPKATDKKGRFAIKLKQPGSVVLGYAFLQPGSWGRFKGLPVRKDVANALIDQGITVLRYGGSMVNHREYRWKKMIGPRDRRAPYRGTWYPHSSNGWGILDFLDFCEEAGFLAIPAFNMDETPQDMADFVEYVNGPRKGEWGQKRAAAGHSSPYKLRYLELGNEERVDDNYFEKFKPLAEAIWATDPDIIIVVGDFVYTKPIVDPFNFTGSVAGLTSLAAHQKILQLAKQHQREVWFDLHVGTDGPKPDSSFEAMLSFVEALDRVAYGARHQVAVFEFNAGNHRQQRALANALAINAIERNGRIPVATSANCLQPDGQNDNGWNQGLLFLNPSQVWLQPPGWVTRMISKDYQPLHVPAEVTGSAQLDVSAKRSENGKTLVLQVVNPGKTPVAAQITLTGFAPAKPVARVEELAGPLDTVNTAEYPNLLTPKATEWRYGLKGGPGSRVFPPQSFTILRFE